MLPLHDCYLFNRSLNYNNTGEIQMANIKKLFGKCKVENGTKFRIEITTLYDLYLLGSHGVEGEEPEINSAKGFLQRLAQKQEWNRNQKRRAKSYIKSLIKGSGLLDSFILIPGDLLLDSVKSKMIDAEGEALKAWKTVSKYIEERITRGAKYFIIDGQNRLNESIVPFFDSKFALPEEAIVFVNEDKKRENIANLKFEALDKDIQDYIKNIQVPLVIASAGDIEEFSDTLIWKNEGIAWDDWQKQITEQWYTKFRRQLSSIASKDEGDSFSIAALERISGAKYMYDVNGLDLIVAELFAWMNTQVQPTKIDDLDSYFLGTNVITETQVKLLKKYLKEFDGAYDLKKITNVELRNYVMLRYVIDNPSKFKYLDVPPWKIEKGTDFASIYKIINHTLMKAPTKYGQLPSYEQAKLANGGSAPKTKVAGSYVWCNSESKPKFIEARLSILLNVLQNTNGKTPLTILNDLHKNLVVIELDTAAMTPLEQMYQLDPNDNHGNKVPVSTLKSRNFDRGHKTAKSKGGSNTDLTMQGVRENRQQGDNYYHKEQ